ETDVRSPGRAGKISGGASALEQSAGFSQRTPYVNACPGEAPAPPFFGRTIARLRTRLPLSGRVPNVLRATRKERLLR
ncbi:MAG TPA: hypothetical protein VKG25_23440, partial [Bryobacteraceae bacterium]|nr:hypothetical protein [Bryobacteraceae bacterium]